MTEDEKIGWHHQLDGHEFEQVLGVGDGQGSLACCSPWVRKESDMTERVNNNKFYQIHFLPLSLFSFWDPYNVNASTFDVVQSS